jgi:hypothetical protein
MTSDIQRSRYPSLYHINTRVWLSERNKECRGSTVGGEEQ